MSSVGRCLLVLCIFVCASRSGSAAESGSIVGKVVDQTGAGLPGVTVELATAVGEAMTVSDATGAYWFDVVPFGPAELTFRSINFTVPRRTVTVDGGQTSVGDVVMQLSLRADVIVTGVSTFRTIADIERPAENLVGIASAASQGAITAAQLAVRPIMRAGEVLETVPGMIVSQHSGEGKANQYYVRGFNLDHGTDFSTTVAGVPVNMPTGAHAHGYSDLNFLIPELSAGCSSRRGRTSPMRATSPPPVRRTSPTSIASSARCSNSRLVKTDGAALSALRRLASAPVYCSVRSS
jgi:hypothetical protein